MASVMRRKESQNLWPKYSNLEATLIFDFKVKVRSKLTLRPGCQRYNRMPIFSWLLYSGGSDYKFLQTGVFTHWIHSFLIHQPWGKGRLILYISCLSQYLYASKIKYMQIISTKLPHQQRHNQTITFYHHYQYPDGGIFLHFLLTLPQDVLAL